MKINRRTVLGVSGYALAGSLMSARLALAAAEMKTLHLLASVGKPSIAWTTLDVLRPGLQQALKGEVVIQAVTGHDGLDALHEVLQAGAEEPRLFGTGIMSTQYAWRIVKADVRLESLTPIAKADEWLLAHALRQARQRAEVMGRSRQRPQTSQVEQPAAPHGRLFCGAHGGAQGRPRSRCAFSVTPSGR